MTISSTMMIIIIIVVVINVAAPDAQAQARGARLVIVAIARNMLLIAI